MPMRPKHLLSAICALGLLWPIDALAEELRIPGLAPPEPEFETLELPACANTRDETNCARTLACIGRQGLWFDGQARGWNEGVLFGQMAYGGVCAGEWAYDGPFNSATASLQCDDGLSANVLYYAQDPETGTGRARGFDSKGRMVRAWTGRNVLAFLTPDGGDAPELPCTDAPIPMS